MIESFYIAWKYVTFNKLKTVILIACITLIAFLPLGLQRLLTESEQQLLSRAVSTPLIVGAKGSALDLVMNTLYFGDEVPELISMADSQALMDSDLALAVPVYVRFRARGHAIVGTTLDYFDFRSLKVAEGRGLAVLGDCVVGATVAKRLGLAPGDSLISSPDNLFDLAGVYPLKMRVAGVLEKAHTSDDLAIFVDLKTAWVIEGLGHGHEDITKTQDSTVILSRTETNVVANAKLEQYTEITEANLDSFHFHGNTLHYPISAVIALPRDAKAGTILRGRYLLTDAINQIAQPKDVIDELLQNIFRIKNVLDAVIGLVGLATVLAVVLVFALSLRLRQREISTIFKLGCSRMTIARLLGAEIFIIVLISGILSLAMMAVLSQFANDLVRALFIR
ncbi:MAG: ABC transporter permease [Gammaproteobacteria bacterium]|nr:ABC transporter permease [Gammaproteobacteria bacterium]